MTEPRFFVNVDIEVTASTPDEAWQAVQDACDSLIPDKINSASINELYESVAMNSEDSE